MRFRGRYIPKLSLISGVFVLVLVLTSVFAPWIANAPNPDSIFPLIPHSPDPRDPTIFNFLSPPDSEHWLGTDNVGRDLLARLIHGLKNSLFFSVGVVLVCILLGSVLGGIMGFFGGWVDLVLSRFMEVIGNFPIFLLQLTFLAFFDANYGILLFVMCLAGWIPYCRFTRAEFLKLRNQEFIQAANSLGASKSRVFFKHLLPNSLTPTIIYIPFDLSTTITTLGALSFLGFGEPINVASLGELMKQAKEHFDEAWWIAVFPGGLLFLMTLSLALFGSSLRDLLDPRSE